MTPLSQEFVDSCPVENGFHMRGLEMTRLEVFVDAAFAFAVTMLVISFDSMPSSYEELVYAIKSIPAFIVAVAQLVWIWYTHNIWSRRFGLDTPYTVFISTALLIVVLIYVYPMRIMAGGMFSWFSNGYLPSDFSGLTLQRLQDMFIFLSIGFIVLSLVFAQMYRYAIKLREPLRLDAHELYWSQTFVIMWLGAAAIGALCIVLAITLPARWVPLSGFAFSLLGAWFPLAARWRGKREP
ncbi:MAG TPA: TMEM175 family protein [Xanthomonadales bacterium]|nr:TMEM175 family protein [Xanthomonadales bacterium]